MTFKGALFWLIVFVVGFVAAYYFLTHGDERACFYTCTPGTFTHSTPTR